MHELQELSNIVAVAVGGGGNGGNITRNVALKKDGTVATWGTETTYGDMTPPAGLSNVVAIAVGRGHSLGLKMDGTVFGWGFNREAQATGVPSKGEQYVSSGLVKLNGQVLSNVVAVAAAEQFSMALKRDGTVVGWGLGYPSTPAGLSNVTAIAAGRYFCLAITTNASFLENKK